ncbi:MAG: pyridoxamine 5'-phosphate oxidase family protein [Bacteroides sp.]
MRRNDKEVTDFDEKLAVLRQCEILRIGMSDGGFPYIVPVNFGLEEENGQVRLYFHSAAEGRKVDILKKNPEVCFETDYGFELKKAPLACNWTAKYRCVMGVGKVEPVTEKEEKTRAFEVIMEKYGFPGMPEFDISAVERTNIYKLSVEEFSVKQSI